MGRVNGWVDSRARSKVALLPGVYACRRCRRCRLCRLFARELVLTNSTNGANLWAQVQIYDMATDSWSLGRDLPYSVGSASTAVIGGYVYLCGGILQVDRSGKCILGPGRQSAWGARVLDGEIACCLLCLLPSTSWCGVAGAAARDGMLPPLCALQATKWTTPRMRASSTILPATSGRGALRPCQRA